MVFKKMFSKLEKSVHPQDPAEAKRAEYQTTKLLGQGAQGTVKLATHLPTGRQLALKSVKKQTGIMTATKKTENQEIAREVGTEVQIMLKLNHPHIIKLVEYFETKDKHYMVSELATGGDLFDRIMAKGSFNERDAAIAMATVVNAVMYLHDHDICHRDLKPPNMLFKDESASSPLVLVDFGVARIVGKGEMMQTITGTPYFIAPEILRQNGYTKQVDVWSLGCIAYTLLSGVSPFQEAMDQQELFTRILKADYNFNGPEWAEVSPEAKAFIKSLLTVNPQRRPTARDALTFPWLLKFVPAAYLKLLEEINREADPVLYKVNIEQPLEMRAPTLSRLRGKVPGTLEVVEELATETESAPLPNLLDNIAKRRLKKAINAVRMATAMSAFAVKGMVRRESETSATLSPSGTSASDLDAPDGVLPMPSEEALKEGSGMANETGHETEELSEKLKGIVVNAESPTTETIHFPNPS